MATNFLACNKCNNVNSLHIGEASMTLTCLSRQCWNLRLTTKYAKISPYQIIKRAMMEIHNAIYCGSKNVVEDVHVICH